MYWNIAWSEVYGTVPMKPQLLGTKTVQVQPDVYNCTWRMQASSGPEVAEMPPFETIQADPPSATAPLEAALTEKRRSATQETLREYLRQLRNELMKQSNEAHRRMDSTDRLQRHKSKLLGKMAYRILARELEHFDNDRVNWIDARNFIAVLCRFVRPADMDADDDDGDGDLDGDGSHSRSPALEMLSEHYQQKIKASGGIGVATTRVRYKRFLRDLLEDDAGEGGPRQTATKTRTNDKPCSTESVLPVTARASGTGQSHAATIGAPAVRSQSLQEAHPASNNAPRVRNATAPNCSHISMRQRNRPSFLRSSLEGARPETGEGPFDRNGKGERSIERVPASSIPLRLSYPRCKTSVQPPGDWDSTEIQRSAHMPAASLELEHAFGYRGTALCRNLQFGGGGGASRAANPERLIYFVASTAVVCDSPLYSSSASLDSASAGAAATTTTGINAGANVDGVRRQRFFLGHTDDISCLAVDPSGDLIATGQVGKEPFVCIWRVTEHGTEQVGEVGAIRAAMVSQKPAVVTATDLVSTQRRPDPYTESDFACFYERGICAVSFCSNNRYLIAIGMDNKHTVGLWDWHNSSLIASNSSRAGLPPQVYDVVACPHRREAPVADFVTFGKGHVHFWTIEIGKRKKGEQRMTLESKPTRSDMAHVQLVKNNGRFGGSNTPPRHTYCAAFTPDGNSVVTGGDNGWIYVWSSYGICDWSFEAFATAAVRSMCLSPKSNGLLTGGSDGKLKCWRTDDPTREGDGKGDVFEAVAGKENLKEPITIDVISDGYRMGGSDAEYGEIGGSEKCSTKFAIARGSESRNAATVRRLARDPEQMGSGKPKQSRKRTKMPATAGPRTLPAHSITSITVSENGTIAVGTTRSLVFTNLAVREQPGGPPVGSKQLVTLGHSADVRGLAVRYRDAMSLFVTVGEDGMLGVWDAKTSTLLHRHSVPPAGSVDISATNLIAVGGIDGTLTILRYHPRPDVGDAPLEPISVSHKRICRTAVVEMRFSPDGEYLAVASHDQSILIIRTMCWKVIHQLSGHSARIVHMDWSVDSKILQSNCIGGEIMYWSAVDNGKQIRSTFDDVEANTKWATWTCTLGFPVMGIWADGASLSDVNACDVSPDRKYLVTADDQGTCVGSGAVKLFNAPCVVEDAPHREYSGHSSQVCNVRFVGMDRIVSVGGADCTMLLWRVKHPRQSSIRATE